MDNPIYKTVAFTIEQSQDEWLSEQSKTRMLNKSIIIREAIELLKTSKPLVEIEQIISGLQIPLGGVRGLNEVLSFFINTPSITIKSLIIVTGLERDDVKSLISRLVEKGALEKNYSYYVKTLMFTNWLKERLA